MFKKIGILGFGAFGLAMLDHIYNELRSKGYRDTILSVYDDDNSLIDYVAKKRKHKYFFKSVRINQDVQVSRHIDDFLKDTELVIVCIPAQHIRSFFTEHASMFRKDVNIMNCSKGLEDSTGKVISEIIDDSLGSKSDHNYAFFSGGMIASDFIMKKGTFCADMVSHDPILRRNLNYILSSKNLKIIPKSSVSFSECLSALKNVVAIGVGFLEGLGYPDSVRSLFIASSLYEIRRFSSRLSGTKEKDPGLSFMGDYITSTTGNTRNRRLGYLIGKGKTPEQAIRHLKKNNMTAEGFWTTKAVETFIKDDDRSFPIMNTIHEILHESRDVWNISGFLN